VKARLSDAVVVGFETNGLGVARALAKERIPVTAIAGSTWDPSWYTRCTRRVITCREWAAECLIETLVALGKQLPRPAPLLMTKDEAVLWVSAHREELRPYFTFALPNDDTVQLLMNKIRFEAYARQQKWPLPASWAVVTKNDIELYADSISFPCVLKVAIKNQNFRRNSPCKVFKISDREALVRTYELVRQWEPEVLIQEWLSGPDDRITYCLGYWSTDGEPIALFAGRKLRQWPPECGGTAIAAPAPDEWVDTVRSLTTTIMAKLAYAGLGSIEFKMRQDGSPVLIEPTVGRTNYQNEVAALNGVNIPAAAYYDLIGRREQSRQWLHPKPHSKGVKLIDQSGDIQAADRYMRSGTLTLEEWRRTRAGPRKFMLFRVDDPMPFLISVMQKVKRRWARIVRRQQAYESGFRESALASLLYGLCSCFRKQSKVG
jgi:predicted ATP-grasp superfamily ATP-dependent carboligase